MKKVQIYEANDDVFESADLPFHGSNRGSNPRGDANKNAYNIGDFPQIDGKLPLIGGGWYLPQKPAKTRDNLKPIANKLRIGKGRSGRGAA